MDRTGQATLTYPTIPLPGQEKPGRTKGILLLVAIVAAAVLLFVLLPGPEAGLPAHGRLTLVIFALAIISWLSGKIDDTFVGLAAAVALVLTGVIESGDLFGALGSETIWLLIAAFVLAAGLTVTGLPTRAAILLCAKAHSPRQLVHLITAALVLTALAVPATSGRAALALPVFLALAKALDGRAALVRALALIFPTVILFSAVASLIGAGAHVITSDILATLTGTGFSYGFWLLLGLPFAVISSHLAAEFALLLMTRREDRRELLTLDAIRLGELAGTRVHGPLTNEQRRSLAILVGVVLLWCTESLHHTSPALVALIGAVLISAPKLGTVKAGKAVDSVPWSLLIFMTTTTVLGTALSVSGAANWLGGAVFGQGTTVGIGLLVVVVLLSTAAHLVLQSRSARSSVLVPLVIPLAMAGGLNPAAVAFASTVAAGFCHTLSSSAKPVAMFASVTDVPTYRQADLLRFSALFAPVFVGLLLVFALFVWPVLGLPTQ